MTAERSERLPERLLALAGPDTRVVPGWGTVELERGVVEAGPALGLGQPDAIEAAEDDEALGARCRLLRFAADEIAIVLEPATEGRLAGALARSGEGVVARWILIDDPELKSVLDGARAAGLRPSRESAGPLGPERLLDDGSRGGPFLLLASARRVVADVPPAATIER